jgi:hypothetical protein
MEPGEYYREWDGLDGRGAGVSSGIYFCRLKTDDEELTSRIVLLR